MQLKDLLIRQSKNKSLAVNYKNQFLSYEDLYIEVNSVLKHINSIDVQISANVGIFLPNSIEYIIAYFSITFNDKVIVPIPIQFSNNDIQKTVEFCEMNFIITNSNYKKRILELFEILKVKIIVYVIDEKKYEVLNSNGNEICDVNSYSNLTPDVALMLATSGTTSNPKRVMLTHKNLISNIESVIKSHNYNSDDNTLIFLPLYFGYCNTSQFLTHFYLGATLTIMDNIFLPNKFLKIIEDKRITNLAAVPTMLMLLLKNGDINRYNLSSLKYIFFGGGSTSRESILKLMNLFKNVELIQTYGQTEASPRLTYLNQSKTLEKVGSIGKALPGIELKIVNNSDEELGANQIGEIKVRGDNIMKGYYKMPNETEKVLKKGWLYTGDLAQKDDDGFLFLLGRKGNLIIRNGLNVYPEEIEKILITHFNIKEVLPTEGSPQIMILNL